jgi:serine/threonine-protein kinase
MGRPQEAVREASDAQQLDPLSAVVAGQVSSAYRYARQFDRAVAGFRQAVELNPRAQALRLGLASTLAGQGAYEAALEVLDEVSDPNGGRTAALRAYSYAGMGNHPRARELLAALHEEAKREYVSSGLFAIVHGALGELDQAFAWLERARQERSGLLLYARVDPLFDPLRGDPRFDSLLREMRLE